MANITEVITIGQVSVRFLLEGADTSGQMAMFEFTVPAGARVPLPHSHSHFDETVYGLEGIITFTVGGKVFNINPGETCYIPRDVIHGFNNLSTNATAKGLCVITPAAIGPEFFKDSAEVVNAGGPPDIEKQKAVFKKHGIVPALP